MRHNSYIDVGVGLVSPVIVCSYRLCVGLTYYSSQTLRLSHRKHSWLASPISLSGSPLRGKLREMSYIVQSDNRDLVMFIKSFAEGNY